MPIKFPDYSKAEWLEKVTKDLKGKPLDSLNWTVEGETYTPFWHQEDITELPSLTRQKQSCLIGVKIEVDDPKEANQLALAALAGGANFIYYYDALGMRKEGDREALLSGILTDIVEVVTHFGPKPFLTYSRENIADGLFMLSLFPERLFRIWIELSGDYFQDIALLRSTRLCANLICQANNVPPKFQLGVVVPGDVSDPNSAKIRATIRAIAAMIGGADILLIQPADGSNNNTFERRIARNIQHLLIEESHLNHVADPAAGSYYVEALTDTFAKNIWAEFQESYSLQAD